MQRRVPPVVADYFLGGASDEQTLRDNVEAFKRARFNPSYGVKLGEVDMSTTVLGHKISMPVIAAPVGSLRTLWPRGEAVAAAAAGKAGTICTLSTLTGTSLEEVKAATTEPCWFQLYLVGGKEVAIKAIRRVQEAGYSALVLTIDTPVAGLRMRDLRNGSKDLIGGTLAGKLRHAPRMSRHLSWLISFYADGGLMKFPTIQLPGGKPMPYADIGQQLQQSAVTWDDIGWIKEAWNRPLIIKGIHNAHDAKRAADHGAQAIIISNHGGRQLDRVLPTLTILQTVVPELKDSGVEILMDGGIRSGGDVVIALATGAKAVLVGRAYAYGLGAGGEAGVSRAFMILKNGIEHTLRQLGCNSIAKLNGSYLAPYPFK
jgi:isopentenyl diphosphate isomerase/L-lactate dehydrogenase-like FMN-dependent dehydrogenase